MNWQVYMKIFVFILLFIPLLLTAKVYDCFMFSNELDVLEIRLNELYPYVDKFVLVEWNKNHRKHQEKPFYFELNKERFSKFLDKIIHIKLEDSVYPNTGSDVNDAWIRERWHRDQLMRGLTDAEDNDIIFISDADEFYPGEKVEEIKNKVKQFGAVCLVQKMYLWFLNRYDPNIEYMPCTSATTFKYLKSHSIRNLRESARTLSLPAIWTGWHFTWMGGYEVFKEKLTNIVEGNDEIWTYEKWRAHVNSWPLTMIDNSYPKFVRENILYLLRIGLIDFED